MFLKHFSLKSMTLALSALALLSTSEMSAVGHCNKRSRHVESAVIPAQANYQDTTTYLPAVGTPIPFSVENFRRNVRVDDTNSIFEVVVPGLYSLDAYLLVDVETPVVGDVVSGYITINGRQLLTFFESETVETVTAPTILNFHFGDRLVYLEKGDKVSVVLTQFNAGTTVLSRGLVLVALNNSR